MFQKKFNGIIIAGERKNRRKIIKIKERWGITEVSVRLSVTLVILN